jgi:Terpene cyclase DEP1
MGRTPYGALYWALIALFGAGFAAAFAIIVVPPLLENPDIPGAFAAGFVNPYAAGYSLDTIFCWLILSTWIIYERVTLKVRHGWIAIILGLAPGVATAFALYLFLRRRAPTAA